MFRQAAERAQRSSMDSSKLRYVGHHLIFYLNDGSELYGYVRSWNRYVVQVESFGSLRSLAMSKLIGWEVAEGASGSVTYGLRAPHRSRIARPNASVARPKPPKPPKQSPRPQPAKGPEIPESWNETAEPPDVRLLVTMWNGLELEDRRLFERLIHAENVPAADKPLLP